MQTTFSPAPSNRAARKKNGHGFTLVELLIVIGIIALLVALLVPVIGWARKQATKSTKAMMLQTIGSALSVYHQDFGIYPSMPTFGENDSQQIGGSALLGRALLGPGPMTYSETDGPGYDGADGYGFRIRTWQLPSGQWAGGQIYGPYLRPEKFPVQIVDYPANSANPQEMYGYQILDTSTTPSTPILYAPARVPQPSLNLNTPDNNQPPFAVNNPYALYYMPAFDIEYFALMAETGYITPGTPANVNTPAVSLQTPAIDRIQMLLGDYSNDSAGGNNFDGLIETGEAPITEAFILFTAGPSGLYGFGDANAVPKGKDRNTAEVVTNFSSGQK